jgi:hypothetical protein
MNNILASYGLTIGQWLIVGFGLFVAVIMAWQILKFFWFALKQLMKYENGKKNKGK